MYYSAACNAQQRHVRKKYNVHSSFVLGRAFVDPLSRNIHSDTEDRSVIKVVQLTGSDWPREIELHMTINRTYFGSLPVSFCEVDFSEYVLFSV